MGGGACARPQPPSKPLRPASASQPLPLGCSQRLKAGFLTSRPPPPPAWAGPAGRTQQDNPPYSRGIRQKLENLCRESRLAACAGSAPDMLLHRCGVCWGHAWHAHLGASCEEAPPVTPCPPLAARGRLVQRELACAIRRDERPGQLHAARAAGTCPAPCTLVPARGQRPHGFLSICFQFSALILFKQNSPCQTLAPLVPGPAGDQDWWGKHRITIGEKMPEGLTLGYSAALASSKFCFVLPGDGWSARLEDAVLHGCAVLGVHRDKLRGAVMVRGPWGSPGIPGQHRAVLEVLLCAASRRAREGERALSG